MNFITGQFSRGNLLDRRWKRKAARVRSVGWSRSGSVIRDHSDHGRSNEPMNPCTEWIKNPDLDLPKGTRNPFLDLKSVFGFTERNTPWATSPFTIYGRMITTAIAMLCWNRSRRSNEMTSLSILLAAVFLCAGSSLTEACSSNVREVLTKSNISWFSKD